MRRVFIVSGRGVPRGLPHGLDSFPKRRSSDLVLPMALAAAAAGADGLMIEVHNDPMNALCDGAQSLTPGQFDSLCARVNKVREAVLS